MKEYRSRSGGRFIFNEDIQNLQELALSPTEMFKDSGVNFVISGCAISVARRTTNGVYYYDVSITSGYAFINNRVVKVPAFTQTVNVIHTIGIYEKTAVGPNIMYANGAIDPEYNEYSGEIKINDSNSGNVACVIATGSVTVYAFPNMRTAYMRHYCLVNNGTLHHYDDSPYFDGGITVKYQINLTENNSTVVPISITHATMDNSFVCPVINAGATINGIAIGMNAILSSNNALIMNTAAIKNLYSNKLKANYLNYQDEEDGIDVHDIVGFFDALINEKTIDIISPNTPDCGPGGIKIFANDLDGQYIKVTSSVDYDGNIYDSVTIKPHEISVLESTDPDHQTKISKDRVICDNMFATRLYDRGSGLSLGYILVEDIANFFRKLNDHKTIEILGPNDDTYNTHGTIKICTNEVNGQYMYLANAANDEGEFDSITIRPTGISLHHDEDELRIDTEGLWGDIHSEYIYDKDTYDSVRVADVIEHINNINGDGNSGRTVTVNELNAIFEASSSDDVDDNVSAMIDFAGNGFVNKILTTNIGNNVIQIGYVSLFSCDMRHQLTIEITSNYILEDDCIIGQKGHRDGALFTYVRHFGFRDNVANGLVRGQWTNWEEKIPIQTFSWGYTGNITVDGKLLMFDKGLLIDVH